VLGLASALLVVHLTKCLFQSGISYTIIHPGGLVDKDPDVEELVLDVDDKLMANTKRSISRADVASLCVASLSTTVSVSLDCITRVMAEGEVPKSPEKVLEEFLKTGKTTDYSL
jgi:NAD(P)H-binding